MVLISINVANFKVIGYISTHEIWSPLKFRTFKNNPSFGAHQKYGTSCEERKKIHHQKFQLSWLHQYNFVKRNKIVDLFRSAYGVFCVWGARTHVLKTLMSTENWLSLHTEYVKRLFFLGITWFSYFFIAYFPPSLHWELLEMSKKNAKQEFHCAHTFAIYWWNFAVRK